MPVSVLSHSLFVLYYAVVVMPPPQYLLQLNLVESAVPCPLIEQDLTKAKALPVVTTAALEMT
jgi:hypothetical protein